MNPSFYLKKRCYNDYYMSVYYKRNYSMRRMSGFSLMEMMVVLLITAVVAAATAPMINKKLMHDQAEAGSPWIYTSNANSIAYNIKNSPDMSVSIGAVKPKDNKKTALYVGSNRDQEAVLTINNYHDTSIVPHILLKGGTTGNHQMGITYNSGIVITGTNDTRYLKQNVEGVIIGDKAGYVENNNSPLVSLVGPIVAIGKEAKAKRKNTIAIGNSTAELEGGIAIGNKYEKSSSYWYNTVANKNSIAIGNGASTTTSDQVESAIAIGTLALARATNSIAIGGQLGYSENRTQALHENSVAIGAGATTTEKNQIVLGDANTTVYIPGNLIVDRNTVLTTSSTYRTYVQVWGDGIDKPVAIDTNGEESKLKGGDQWSSDRRLKNVGKAFTGGLEEVKKLELFNYTYKKDPEKTPHVGVMAQDLEKIFPNAVFKGDDGFLRIRMEDMFYAMVNAIKELDNKLKLLEQKQKKIDELEARLDKLEKRLEKLEKKAKKD